MATYDFTDSWTNETFIKDSDTYTFTNLMYDTAITDAEFAGYAPTGGDPHSADLQPSFGNPTESADINILNFVDFDYSNAGTSDWTAMNEILGDDLL